MIDQPRAQQDQPKIQHQQRNQQRHYFGEAVITRSRDERAKHREWQREDSNPGAERRERRSLLREHNLNLAKDHVVRLWWLVRFHTSLAVSYSCSPKRSRKVFCRTFRHEPGFS